MTAREALDNVEHRLFELKEAFFSRLEYEGWHGGDSDDTISLDSIEHIPVLIRRDRMYRLVLRETDSEYILGPFKTDKDGVNKKYWEDLLKTLATLLEQYDQLRFLCKLDENCKVEL